MAHFFTFTPKKKAATDIDFIHLIESTGMKILVATEKPFAKEAVDGIRRIVEDADYELALLEKYTDKAQLLAAVADVDALIVRSDKVTAEVIGAAKNLKIVVRAGAGYDNVDLAAATARGDVVLSLGLGGLVVAELLGEQVDGVLVDAGVGSAPVDLNIVFAQEFHRRADSHV